MAAGGVNSQRPRIFQHLLVSPSWWAPERPEALSWLLGGPLRGAGPGGRSLYSGRLGLLLGLVYCDVFNLSTLSPPRRCQSARALALAYVLLERSAQISVVFSVPSQPSGFLRVGA